MTPRLAMLAMVLVLAAERPALASVPAPIMPLWTGYTWHYANEDGSSFDLVMSGPVTTALGQTAYQRDNLDGHGRADWWTIAPNGDLLLAGLGSVGNVTGITYDPPVVFLGANPQVGDSWTTNTNAIGETGVVNYHLTLTVDVVQEGDVIEPAGVLHIVALNVTENYTAAAVPGARSVDPVGPASTTYNMLFAPQLGVAESPYSNGLTMTTMHLASYGMPTPTQGSTWGRLKALYR